jgi:hypothetical protein
MSNQLQMKTNEKVKKRDNYTTPKEVWESISQFIPKDKVIWECFYNEGHSGSFLKDLGFNVIHEDIDFFENIKGDVIISNPPFSIKQKVFQRLKELDKPFIMICPTSVLATQFFQKLFKNNIQIIIPKKRIDFVGKKSSAWFECFFYCYKMNLEKDITFL